MTVRICKSTDSGAPVISQTIGSIETLLDAVLVNGYGTREPLGWASHYRNVSTGRKYYLQGTGSSGRILMIQDNAANAGCYSDFLAQVGLAHPAGEGMEPSAVVGLYASAGIERPDNFWEVIGDESFFYLLTGKNVWGGQYGLRSVFACGDIRGYAETDLGRALIASNARSANGSRPVGQWCIPVSGTGFNAAISQGYGPMDLCGMPDSPGNCPSATLFRALSCDLSAFNSHEYPGVARKVISSPLMIGHILQGSASPSLRGQLPGFRIPLHKVSAYHPPAFSTVQGESGKTHLVVYSADSGQSGISEIPLLFEISDTWGS